MDIRGNPTPDSGLLQLDVGGTWKYVCDDGFNANNNAANVACSELGYGTGSVSFSLGLAPQDDLFWDDMTCSGSESSLAQCTYSTEENCGATEAACLKCTLNATERKALRALPVPTRDLRRPLSACRLRHHGELTQLR